MIAMSKRDPRTDMVRETIMDRITSLARKKNLSQSELARRLGLERQTVSKWLTIRDQVPNEANMIAIAEVLETSISYLYGETDYPGRPAQWAAPTSELSARTDEARRRLLEVVDLLDRRPAIPDSYGVEMTEEGRSEKLAGKTRKRTKALGE